MAIIPDTSRLRQEFSGPDKFIHSLGVATAKKVAKGRLRYLIEVPIGRAPVGT
ncbi:hypothetical protein WBP06_09170 [Novosphingobium sp. BL-8H]|uniref:hypothetical protein n=1 Tax=Novosphingobium sp. BL-8H TaxID=3127640 RepID=UPI003756D72F